MCIKFNQNYRFEFKMRNGIQFLASEFLKKKLFFFIIHLLKFHDHWLIIILNGEVFCVTQKFHITFFMYCMYTVVTVPLISYSDHHQKSLAELLYPY